MRNTLQPDQPGWHDANTFPSETFRVLKEKEQRQYGEYRTRRLVLEAWENTVGEKRRCTPTPPPINGDSQ